MIKKNSFERKEWIIDERILPNRWDGKSGLENSLHYLSKNMHIATWSRSKCSRRMLYDGCETCGRSCESKRGDLQMQSAYIHLYLIIINIITFALYGLDKWRAMTRQWRIREKKLIGLALIGGSIGAMIGMTVFHHKTRKWYFKLGIPGIFVLQIMFAIHFILKSWFQNCF